ncbi:MAG: sulfotransferase, partial [Steroidobacteraceae bacterium]
DGLGAYDEALRIYRELARQQPANAELPVLIASLLKTRGSGQEAIAALRAAAATPAACAEALFGLANTKSYRFADEEIALMRTREAVPGAPLPDRYRLCFALGRALEDRAEYAESFRYYARGNALKRSELRYDPDLAERQMQLQSTVCTAGFFAARPGVGCTRPDPIFVLGLPRSGSTLIEQILASHPRVDGTLELPEIPRLVQQFRDRVATGGPPRYPGVLAGLEPERFRHMGEYYLEETRPYRRGAEFFVDKLPGNFRDIGFIHLILPNARIIDARRAPMACCFGNFKQLFVNGQEFTYDLADLGRYYRNYVALMEHWDRVLPGKVLRVRHEDVVHDLEGSVRRLLGFLVL